jgi:cell division protein FtsQ
MGRRRLQRLVDVGLVLAVAAGFGVALRSPLLDVDEVVVSGATRTSTAHVVEVAGVERGEQLMDLDLRAAGERIAELPWVQAVEVRRGLDGQVVLAVTERTAVAVVGEGDGAVLVDGEGLVLARAADEPELVPTLVRITDVPDGAAPGQRLTGARPALALASQLATVPDLPVQITSVDGLVGTLTDSGIEVRFGDPGLLDAKVRSLRTVLEQVDLTCAGVIDVGSPGSPVLTREEGCS